MSPQTTSRKSKKRRAPAGGALMQGYLVESQRPLVMLAFVAPFIILHEVGARLFGIEVAAGALLRVFVSHVGLYGRTIPAVMAVLTLLLWHLLQRDRWGLRLSTPTWMALESFIFALPIFGISLICRQFLPLTTVSSHGLAAGWTLSLGAGVYEELLFRLYLCGFLLMVAKYVFRLRGDGATIFAVLASAILFSLYHYIGSEQFGTFSFIFRALAGVYFAGLLASRGFGITAGAHAFYDVVVVTWGNA